MAAPTNLPPDGTGSRPLLASLSTVLPSEFATRPHEEDYLSATFSVMLKEPVGVRCPSMPEATYVHPAGAPPRVICAFCSLRSIRTATAPASSAPFHSYKTGTAGLASAWGPGGGVLQAHSIPRVRPVRRRRQEVGDSVITSKFCSGLRARRALLFTCRKQQDDAAQELAG